ncbi:MAG: sugar transferase [Gemmatimonadetes bacterium]|nr:sugar transferase [Gemmatimonadota bacterium]
MSNHLLLRRSSHRVVLVGAGPLARATADDLRKRRNVAILGAFTLAGERAHDALGVPVLGSVPQLHAWLESTPVDEVYLCADIARRQLELQAVVTLCERLGVSFAAPAHVFRYQRSLPLNQKTAPYGFLHYATQATKPVSRIVKRAVDVLGSALGLVFLAPVFALVALAIRLDSRGPVFFWQTRVGERGRPFMILKFRSMRVDAEQLKASLLAQNEHATGPVFKMTHDPRITRVGRFIRKLSIDELPQLWNVLRGEMSLVGPRPPIPAEVAVYDAWQRRRLSVPPGITCLWQVSGRNGIGFEQWMRLDMQYIDQWSLLKDFQLLGRTIPAVLGGRGAS